MSINLHLESRRLSNKEARRKRRPKDYVVFDLFQTPTAVSLPCAGKSSSEVLQAYTAWCIARGLNVEGHLESLHAFLQAHPHHVWSVW